MIFGYKLMTERTPDWAMGIDFRGLFLTWCLLCVRSTNALVPYEYKFLFMRVWLPARARRVTWGGSWCWGSLRCFCFCRISRRTACSVYLADSVPPTEKNQPPAVHFFLRVSFYLIVRRRSHAAVGPSSSYSSLSNQKSARSFMISPKTDAPRNTMFFLRGGSSIPRRNL